MVSHLLCETRSDFLDFPGKVTPTPRDKSAKLAKSSEMTVERNATSKQLAFPNFLEKQVAFRHPKHFKRPAQMRGLLQIQMESIMPDL
jgi:hypothetical protein